jgi:hypothetical protein
MRCLRHLRLVFIILPAFILLSGMQLASAQGEARLRLSKPLIDQFPNISAYLSIMDGDGNHIPNLTSEDFVPIEDGISLKTDEVREVLVGLRQIFILNTSRGLRGRDSFGLTRFDYIRQALLDWWGGAEPSKIGLDDLTLLSVDGPLVLHSQFAAELASAIAAYEPAFNDETTSYKILLDALGYLAEPLPHPGMTTSIIFITPFVDDASDLPLADMIARSKEAGIAIHTVLVGPEEILDYPQTENLRLLSEATGGQMFLFNPDEGLLRHLQHILSQRTLYELRYRSQANASGTHEVQVRVVADDLNVISNSTQYQIEVLPPEVVFIHPPNTIARHTEDPSLEPESIPPLSYNLKALITFPDGHPRSIVFSTLSVDGEILSTQIDSPFDTFTWDISSYDETGTHLLQVSIEDELGLQGESSEIPVTIDVSFPRRGITFNQPALATVGVIAAVLILGVVIAFSIVSFSRRRQMKSMPSARTAIKKNGRLPRAGLRKPDRSEIEAILNPVQYELPTVALVGTDILIGKDGALSAVYLDDPSLSPVHARFVRLANGDYILRDQDSIAGTWVNYQLVTEKGQVLHHGDIIHFGRVVYRFERVIPPPAREIHLRPYDPYRPPIRTENKSQETDP